MNERSEATEASPEAEQRSVDLLAAYFTLAGDIFPGSPSEISSLPFEERVAAAGAAGFRGFGLGYADLEATADRLGLSTMRSILDEHGIVHIEFEFLGDWFADGERRAASDRLRAGFLDAAEVLNARHIKVGGDFTGQSWPLERTIEEFARLARDAGNAGTIVALEPMPFSSIARLEDALEIVRAAGEPAGGLCLDIWHIARGGTPMQEIADVPGHLIATVELDDGPGTPPPGPLWDDAVDNRTFCGDGELPLGDFIAALQRAGYDGPYGIEILGAAFRQLPLTHVAERVFATTMQQFDRD